MQSKLQRIELQSIFADNHDLAVEDAPGWQLSLERPQQFRKVSVQWLFVPALNKNVAAVAEHQCPEAIPFGLEDPAIAGRQFGDTLGQHRQERRIHREIHASCYTPE